MTKLLLRIFVKDHKNTQSPAVRAAVGKLAGFVGIACNVLLFVLKLIAGLLSGSVSIVADAMNNLSDAASSVVTLLGFHLAQRPADQDHPYGHARYEYLSGLIVAALIIVIGLDLAEASIRKIFTPVQLELTAITFVVLICSVGIKLWMSLFYKKTGRHISSSALKAASVDSRNDVIATAAVLAGCCINWFFHINVDGYVGTAVALFILWSGVGVAKETISPLLGERASKQLVQQINDLVATHEKVLGIHDLLVHDYGPGQCFASVHVELSAEEDPLVCHDIIDAIECAALERLNVHLVIHYDPVVVSDEELNRMHAMVDQIVTKLDQRLSVHDFRLVRGASQTKLVFDLAIPYGMGSQCKRIKEHIDGKLKEEQLNYATVIRFDEC